jgi:hypothetical protein
MAVPVMLALRLTCCGHLLGICVMVVSFGMAVAF